jgi:hypothetical protein
MHLAGIASMYTSRLEDELDDERKGGLAAHPA